MCRYVKVSGNYHALVEDRIFFGGARDVEAMIKNEEVDVIIDLRGEATQSAYPSAGTEWIQIPLGDNSPIVTEQLFKKAIEEVVGAYKAGKKVGFHCGAGSGRAGTVAAGTLIALGLASTVSEAEDLAKSIRPIVSLGYAQKEALFKIYPNP
ncbi:protein tyrosine phosphatase [Paenibacillus psychroresistens]|uniref:Protein tyrosine phosphatase n=1 Tax=Paenibacillus psychroresistens TaxID=1778678 RepID=A0A6B8RLT7_9BACL|nr:protein tyrosine phosphatase [Paenibacillus psychroresistens]